MNIQHPLKLSSAEFKQNPHPYFRWMRQNQPVYKAKATTFKSAYLITRYDDVSDLLTDQDRLIKNPRTAKSESGVSGSMWLPKAFQPLLHNMLNTDEPDHRRLRNLVHKAFSPKVIREMYPRIEATSQRLLEEAARRPQIDLIDAFALPLPIAAISDLLGIPEADRTKFRLWVERIMVNPTPVNMVKAVPALRSFTRYIFGLAELRRRNPQEDLISGLALAEESGDGLSENELVGTVFLLLAAGHETTVGLISNGVRALLKHPDQLAKLRAQPDLMESAIEEMLRYDGPLQTTEFAFAGKTFELRGVEIPHGSMVLPALLSANRDEAVFENPDSFDIERGQNKHLAFGKGIHYCLGASLARMEAKIAFSTLLEHAPNLRLTVADSDLQFHGMPIVNRMTTLPVAF